MAADTVVSAVEYYIRFWGLYVIHIMVKPDDKMVDILSISITDKRQEKSTQAYFFCENEQKSCLFVLSDDLKVNNMNAAREQGPICRFPGMLLE